ncbi:MAG: restriction endonuclease, partial [Planctomycetota bacterium]
MSITRHHNEWLSLVPNSGPFLSLPVLAQAFPQGLDAHDADHARRLRMAFDEWDDNQLGKRPDSGLHRAWMKFVLTETLDYDELLAEGQAIPPTLKSEVAEYGETLRPDWIVNDPATKKARLLVQVFPRSQSLTKPVASSRWKTSPDTRMMQLLHDTGIRLGIVTNGDHWMLVNAPKNETTGYASWYASLWLEEKDTLRAFRTLLGADRLFSVPEGETLEALLDKSANDQQEVTDQLGYQVRKAVEVLIQSLDKADQDHGRKLLADVDEKILYESALTVMMRLVFLFCAEERELLLLGD